MSKAGPSQLRSAFVRSADTARRQDPQLARIYYLQMTERGATHLKACCVVAGHLAERAWAALSRGTPYVICDNNGNPVTPAEAKKIIAERWTVPEEIRKRRRSRKIAGKAPKILPQASVPCVPPGQLAPAAAPPGERAWTEPEADLAEPSPGASGPTGQANDPQPGLHAGGIAELSPPGGASGCGQHCQARCERGGHRAGPQPQQAQAHAHQRQHKHASPATRR